MAHMRDPGPANAYFRIEDSREHRRGGESYEQKVICWPAVSSTPRVYINDRTSRIAAPCCRSAEP
jgi:hypothetical protein